jgi:enoyl-CoA hydratase/carnithine racemase
VGSFPTAAEIIRCRSRSSPTGAVLDAYAARSAGLVTDVVDGAKLLDRVSAVAATIAKIAPLAVRAVKMLTLANCELSLQNSNALERQTFPSFFGTEDRKEGMKTFLEKRPAQFQECNCGS